MITQYTQAALVAENRRLAAPASVGSIPTGAMREDRVSMGWGAARRLGTMLANLARIVAVELTCAARGLDLRAPLEPAPATAAALELLRGRAGGPGPDRWVAPELAAAEELVRSGALLAAVEHAIGAHGRAAGRRRARDRSARVTLHITHYTDPACPFAFSADRSGGACAGTTGTSLPGAT